MLKREMKRQKRLRCRGMKILALTDIHDKLSALTVILEEASSKVDLILVSGDLTQYGPVDRVREVLAKLEETGRPFFYILGNCDPREALDGVDGFEDHYLHLREVQFQGFTLAGFGGSTVTPFNTPIEWSEEQVEEALKELHLPSERSILLTHEPPADTELDFTKFGIHVGSKSLRRFVENKQPTLHLCGHIHEARGRDQIGRTVIVNPGPVMRGYYAIIKVDGEVGVSFERVW